MRFKHLGFLVWGILAACVPKARVEPESSVVANQPEYLMAINDEPVLAEEFLYTLSKNQHLRGNKLQPLSQEEFDENFALFLNFKLKVKEAEALGMDQSEEFTNEFSIIKEDLKKPYLLSNTIQEGELRKAYSRMQEIVKASHILIEFPPDANNEDSLSVLRMAENLKKKAESGEDFHELALEFSDDPSATNNKGDLGYFTALQMVYPFEDAAYGLQVGKISDPVATNFGYHIIKLEDRRPNPGEIRVSHILIRINQANPVSEDRARRRIAEIYATLQKNRDSWEELVKLYSEDEGTKHSGGLLPWFGVGSIVPEFEEVAFSLTDPHEVSLPVKTTFGFHIVRLEDSKPIASYEDMEHTLKSKILRDSRSQMIQSQVLAMQKAQFGFDENEVFTDTLETLFKNYSAGGLDPLVAALSDQQLLDSTLLVIEEEPVLVRSFIDFIRKNMDPSDSKSDIRFSDWYGKFQEDALDQVEEHELLINNKEYRMLVKEYREGILLFSLMNELVWQKALLDSVGQIEYYNSHVDRYQWPERIPGLIVKMEQEEHLSKVQRFLAGKEYKETLKPRLEDQFLNDYPMLFTLEDGVFIIEDHPVLKDAGVAKKNKEAIYENHHYFLLLGEVITAGSKTFEETRGKVIQDYQKHLDLELIDTLKEKYSIQINEGEKERISQLVVKK